MDQDDFIGCGLRSLVIDIGNLTAFKHQEMLEQCLTRNLPKDKKQLIFQLGKAGCHLAK